MGKVTKALLGEGVSRSTVSRITKELEDQVEALKKAPIDGPITYLYLDATFLDARWARTVENVSALVAYGVGANGHRQLLAITVGAEESEASWTELLQQLLDRGLSGVKLVIADAHAGLAKAVRLLLPEVRQQRCTVHLQRNVLTKAPHRLRARIAKEVSHVFTAPSLKEARHRLDQLKAGLGKQVPEAIEVLVAGFPAATRFYAFPVAHWKRIRSTNSLERLHGEIKRRTRAVGAFP
jgi:transposase-like protein